jgi:hypothetical protein
MLNRTNRTLSANSNRLNLGTRSLANVASVNSMGQVLRIRYLHPLQDADTKRAGMPIRPDSMSKPWIIGPGIPGSPPIATPRPSASLVVRRPWHVGERRVESSAPSQPKAVPIFAQDFEREWERFCFESGPAQGQLSTQGQGSNALALDHEFAFFKVTAWQRAIASKKG